MQRLDAFSFTKDVHKCTGNRNGSAHNTSPIVRVYKFKYSYATIVAILCSRGCIYDVEWLIEQYS